MAGRKRRGFFPTPNELRHKYGDDALVAASIYGSLRPLLYWVFACMGVVLIVIMAVGGSSSASSGWNVALIGLDIAGGSIAMTAVIFFKAKQIASLRTQLH